MSRFKSQFFTQTQDQFKICELCESEISPKSFRTHLIKCRIKTKIRKSKERRAEKKYLKREQNEKQVKIGQEIELKQFGKEVPCAFCGYLQSLEELDSHGEECPNQHAECPFCSALYPLDLLEEHLDLCSQQREEEMKTESNLQIQFFMIKENKKMGKESPNCEICYKHFAFKQDFLFFKCGHNFHMFCIEPWLRQHENCLLCKDSEQTLK